MRLSPFLGLALAGLAAASAMTACSAISGLSAYSSKDCPADGCKDATTHPHLDGQAPAEGSTDDEAGDGATDTLSDDVTIPDGDDTGEDSTSEDAPLSDGADVGAGDGGATDADSGPTRSDAGPPCPDGGCPTSTAATFSSCPFGSCNGSTTSTCTAGGGCYCIKDSQCLSAKCVKVTGENDKSCASNCTGTGGRDGFDCELLSPGIPTPTGGASSYACPAGSGYHSTTLACDPSHTNCYCNADNQCPNGKCVPSASNGNCSGCSGSGAADFRGCQAIAAIPDCPIYIGCPASTACSYPHCKCTSDSVCPSGHCIGCSGCTGTSGAPDDGHGCQLPPSSVACASTGGGTSCTTTLIPAPVLNSGSTACLCVADGDCANGKCVNANTQCTGTCTGSGTHDSENCQTASSVATTWSCSEGNCNNVSSASGTCTAAGVPCWCTSDAQCSNGSRCAPWIGCTTDACTGSGALNPFNCAQ